MYTWPYTSNLQNFIMNEMLTGNFDGKIFTQHVQHHITYRQAIKIKLIYGISTLIFLFTVQLTHKNG